MTTSPLTFAGRNFFLVPGFPAYAATLDALDVLRVRAAERGATAGLVPYRMTPVMHPRGVDWVFQLTQDDGQRKRVSMRKLAKLMLDAYGSTCETSAHE